MKSFKAVVEGEYDHLPENAFYMIGGIDEATGKARSIERISELLPEHNSGE